MSKIHIVAAVVCALGAEARAQSASDEERGSVGTPQGPRIYAENGVPIVRPNVGGEPVGERPHEPAPVRVLEAPEPEPTRVYPPFAWGLEASLGGGVAGFTDGDVRAATGDAAGAWTARVAFRTHRHLGGELGYTGSATELDSQLGIVGSPTLVMTAVEGTARWTFTPSGIVAPYAFGGLGYQRFDLTDNTMALSDAGLGDSDNGFVFPLGAGVAFRRGRAVFDVRGTFRAAANADLVTVDGTSYMHSWAASASLGYRL